jgi:hypothetical protein
MQERPSVGDLETRAILCIDGESPAKMMQSRVKEPRSGARAKSTHP